MVLLTAALCGTFACLEPEPVATRVAASPSASIAAAATATATARPTPIPGARPTPTPAPTPEPSHPPLVAPGWVGPIYPPHVHGSDVSYPQCPAGAAPVGSTFSIVGVNGGKGFTVNPCLAAQWRVARGQRAVYFNSGYDPHNAGKVTPDCAARSRYQAGGDDRRTAYAIGCSEAVFAVNAMRADGADRAAMIWLDVESSNSWDPADLDLNRVALQAEIDELAAFGRLVGLYATRTEWRGIVGDWAPAGIVADWLAGEPYPAGCAAPGFSGHPVWVVQELGTWPSGQDSDWTC
ncbi:MAG TPA: hypothetical protein VOB72_10490 [Candidatus Dormibacteraeota bacterium]|nr:hypothetical protein [Candidatus Dormibacteraeota bacterium]